MQRRICPVCDHVMKHSHYCTFCRQWVSKPNVINASYYLNERHPAGEHSCEYHAASANRSSRNGSPARAVGSVQPSKRVQMPQYSRNESPRKSSGAGPVKKILLMIGMVWLAMTLMGFVVPLLFLLLY